MLIVWFNSVVICFETEVTYDLCIYHLILAGLVFDYLNICSVRRKLSAVDAGKGLAVHSSCVTSVLKQITTELNQMISTVICLLPKPLNSIKLIIAPHHDIQHGQLTDN